MSHPTKKKKKDKQETSMKQAANRASSFQGPFFFHIPTFSQASCAACCLLHAGIFAWLTLQP
jgi:hypothetical protein